MTFPLANDKNSVTHLIPDPLSVPTNRGGRITCKKRKPFLATPAEGRWSLALPAMAVLSSIDTGTPAPPDLLPLDPVSTHRNGTSFVQESDTRLDLYARSAPTGQWANDRSRVALAGRRVNPLAG